MSKSHPTLSMLLISTVIALTSGTSSVEAQLYELRTYTAKDGRLDDLHSRFRDHTCKLFEKHGMKNIGYWMTEGDDPKLLYIISHKSKEAAKASWAAFRKDPKWQAAYKASTANGKLVKKVESQYLTATDFSKLK